MEYTSLELGATFISKFVLEFQVTFQKSLDFNSRISPKSSSRRHGASRSTRP